MLARKKPLNWRGIADRPGIYLARDFLTHAWTSNEPKQQSQCVKRLSLTSCRSGASWVSEECPFQHRLDHNRRSVPWGCKTRRWLECRTQSALSITFVNRRVLFPNHKVRVTGREAITYGSIDPPRNLARKVPLSRLPSGSGWCCLWSSQVQLTEPVKRTSSRRGCDPLRRTKKLPAKQARKY